MAVSDPLGIVPEEERESHAAKLNSILEANKEKNFVQRIISPQNYPSIPMNDGRAKTHVMSWGEQGEGANKKYFAYPEVVSDTSGNLKHLTQDEAWEYAEVTGERIEFGSGEEADWFTKNYKDVLLDPLGIAKKPDPLGIAGADKAESPPTMIKMGKEIGGHLLGTAEAAMSLSSGIVLWPFAKAYGVMALPFGAEAAKMAEEEIASLGYQPYTKQGRDAVDLVSRGMEAYLTPTRMATEEIEKHSPRAAYLTQLGGELVQFGMAGKAGQKGKAKVSHYRAAREIARARKSGLKVMELIRQRRIDIDSAILDSEVFVRDMERNLTPKELEAVPFVRQKMQNPELLSKIGREDLIPLIENPSPKVKAEVQKLGEYFDESHKFLSEHWDDVGFVEDYVTQIWDIPKERKAEVVNYFSKNNPFLKRRTIPTLEAGIELGLEPKTTNIADLVRIYDQHKIKTAFNKKFADAVSKMVNEDGMKVMQRIDKAPPDWVELDHPALRRAMAIGKVGEEGLLLQKVPVKVHPEIATEIKIIFDKPFDHAAIRAMETVNAYTKKSMLSLSFFHHFALTEAAFSSGIGREAVKLWNPHRIYKALKHGDYEIFNKTELAKDAIAHNVRFGALPEVHVGKVRESLLNFEHRTKNTPALRQVSKRLRQANDLWDRSLWDYYHNTLKLHAYEHQVMKELKRRKPTTEAEITAIKNEIGEFVNDSFGGQQWDMSRMLGNPKMRQMLHWTFLAPDWTISTLKQAIAPVKGITQGKKSMAHRGVGFWLRAGFYFNLVAQSANYYESEKHLGEGRFTWENDPGHEMNIFAGFNEDGTKRYLRLGKQFRELGEWLMHPEKKLGSKLAPMAREGIRQLARHDPGSGYPTDFEDMGFWESTSPIVQDREGKWKWQIPPRAASIAEMPLPFSLRPYVEDRPRMFMFSLPASKGMTNYKTVKLFKEALNHKNAPRVERIYFAALENNLDAQSLFRSAKSAVKADITFDDKQMAIKLMSELNDLDYEARMDAYKLYEQRGILTEGIKEQMRKLIEKQQKVEEQKSLLGVTAP